MRIIAGLYKNKQIITSKGLETRPTSARLRETLFNICQGTIEGVNFLDLFAGSGIIGLEALSRGAENVTFVDKSRQSIGSLERNIRELGVGRQTRVLQGDAIEWVERLEKRGDRFDLIYVDPPYGLTCLYEGKKITCSQRILQGVDRGDLLKGGGMLFIEESEATAPTPETLATLVEQSRRQVGRSMLIQYEMRGP